MTTKNWKHASLRQLSYAKNLHKNETSGPFQKVMQNLVISSIGQYSTLWIWSHGVVTHVRTRTAEEICFAVFARSKV